VGVLLILNDVELNSTSTSIRETVATSVSDTAALAGAGEAEVSDADEEISAGAVLDADATSIENDASPPVELTTGGSHTTTCLSIPIKTLIHTNKKWRSVRACFPNNGGQTKYPLHVWAHGDGQGGKKTQAYYPLLKHLANRGFIAVAFHSCENDSSCDNGYSSFLEIYKIIQYLRINPSVLPVDHKKLYSLSGHSTGGRSVLTIAAQQGKPNYRRKVPRLSKFKDIADNIGAVVTIAGDSMYQEEGWVWLNDERSWTEIKGGRDAIHFNISTVPVMAVAAAGDCLEPPRSSWKNFQLVRSPSKIFINMASVNHINITDSPAVYELIARWSRAHVLDDTRAEDSLYKPNQLQADLRFSLANSSTAPAFQQGPNGTCFVGCSPIHDNSNRVCVPKTLAQVQPAKGWWVCSSMEYGMHHA